MKILAVANSCSAQKNQQLNFKSRIIKNDTLAKAFVSAEKQGCERFLDAVSALKNDRLNRTLELRSGVYFSRDGAQYTLTKLIADGKEKEMVGFPNLYGIDPDDSIGNDARLLLIDYAKGYEYNKATKSLEEVQKGIKDLKNSFFK